MDRRESVTAESGVALDPRGEGVTDEEWAEAFAVLEAQNIAEGKCGVCGGAGEVFDVAKITRTAYPFHGKKCPRCKGTGQPKAGDRTTA